MAPKPDQKPLRAYVKDWHAALVEDFEVARLTSVVALRVLEEQERFADGLSKILDHDEPKQKTHGLSAFKRAAAGVQSQQSKRRQGLASGAALGDWLEEKRTLEMDFEVVRQNHPGVFTQSGRKEFMSLITMDTAKILYDVPQQQKPRLDQPRWNEWSCYVEQLNSAPLPAVTRAAMASEEGKEDPPEGIVLRRHSIRKRTGRREAVTMDRASGGVAAVKQTVRGGGTPGFGTKLQPTAPQPWPAAVRKRVTKPPLSCPPLLAPVRRIGEPADAAEVERQAPRQFMRHCEEVGIVPTPIGLFLDRSQSELLLHHMGVRDRDIEAVAAVLPTFASRLDAVDVRENSLTDSGMVTLLDTLHAFGATLTSLRIGGNVNLGLRSSSALVSLLPKVSKLAYLDVEGVAIPENAYLAFSEALSNRQSLRHLNLCRTGLGRGSATFAAEVIGDLISPGCCEYLTHLDLSWNLINGAGAKALAEAVGVHQKLETLHLAHVGHSEKYGWCCCEPRVAGCRKPSCRGNVQYPCLHWLLESLASTAGLQHLDLSANRLNQQSAAVLEAALLTNTTLRSLNLSENSLGEEGMRSVMRGMATEKSSVGRVDMRGCGDAARPGPDYHCLAPVDFSGRFEADLGTVYGRAVARLRHPGSDLG
mmetsp:Transcript_33751/g.87711  ORF Transcript_33751/g.87711 Transcript_33751/m.87711 type:complete len:647 (+) Transcript_33751:23-1963(+)